MIPLSSADTDTTEEIVVDEGRQALLDAIRGELGDAVVADHLVPGQDLWVRVASDAWGTTGEYLRERQGFRFFSSPSGIDWKPSPWGRSQTASVDDAPDSPLAEVPEMQHGVTGGETRFQVIGRVHNLGTQLGVTLKADVPDDTMTVDSWVSTYAGADWHEREAWEMFGVNYAGHPGLRNLYLPGDFEGNPMRKDFPLLARLVKPWPGIVDVEPMPENETGGEA